MALLMCILMILTGCKEKASEPPVGMSEDTYEYTIKALNVMDDYNNGKLSKDEAAEKLTVIYSQLDSLPNSDDDYKNLMVQIEIMSFRYQMFKQKGDTYAAPNEIEELLEVE